MNTCRPIAIEWRIESAFHQAAHYTVRLVLLQVRQRADGCRRRSVHPVVISRKLSEIDSWLLWNTVTNVADSVVVFNISSHRMMIPSLFFSSMRGRQQLSCPVLRPPSGPNARPRTIYTLHKGNNENFLEVNTNSGNYNQSRIRPAFQDPDDKSEGLYPP